MKAVRVLNLLSLLRANRRRMQIQFHANKNGKPLYTTLITIIILNNILNEKYITSHRLDMRKMFHDVMIMFLLFMMCI